MSIAKSILSAILAETEEVQITPDDLNYRYLDNSPRQCTSQTEYVVFIPKHYRIGDEFYTRYFNEETGELIPPCKECKIKKHSQRGKCCIQAFSSLMFKKKK